MKVSVPSRGLSYLKCFTLFLIGGIHPVSVPSRGLSYLKFLLWGCIHSFSSQSSFRPLTGTLLSKIKFGAVKSYDELFPSPHGDSLI